MDIHIPTPPPKTAKVTLARVSARWGKRVAYVRYILEQAGVPIVPVNRPPVPGIRMRDLLLFERSIREQQQKRETSQSNTKVEAAADRVGIDDRLQTTANS